MATMTPAAPLALDSAPHAVREEEALLDALPYVDALDPAEAAAAEAAIAAEVREEKRGGGEGVRVLFAGPSSLCVLV
jgi:hypothetical protein